MRICEANTRILRANFRLKTDAMFIEFQLAKSRINGSPVPRRIELCAGRGRKENASAFLARGRGRRQAAEAGAYLRSKYADSPRNAPAQYGCDADRASCPGLNPSTDPPYRGESNSMQGAGVRKTSRQRGWDALSAPSPQLQNLCALHSKTG